ncbi:MAG: 50S ribosomal protein L1 [Methanomassiliicoccales archaeon]|nr:MAG: 50S ribosomal protein L1 [Methanomassiliicoccales archaeon]
MAEKKTLRVVKEAVESSKPRKFKESVDLAVNLKDIDLSIPKNRIDDEILLPKGRGKAVKIAVFGSGELAVKAKTTADLVITPDELDDLADDKKRAKKMANEHVFFIAEAPLMPVIGKKLGVVLGPRGKMPKPIPPSADPVPLINNLRKTVRIRSKDRRTFHAPVGTKDMSIEDLAENVDVIMKRLVSKLLRGKMNIASVYVKTTMGKSVRLI